MERNGSTNSIDKSQVVEAILRPKEVKHFRGEDGRAMIEQAHRELATNDELLREVQKEIRFY